MLGKRRGVQENVSEQAVSLKSELFEWLETVAFSLVAVVLVFTFIFRIVGVDGKSMQNTLNYGDPRSNSI